MKELFDKMMDLKKRLNTESTLIQTLAEAVQNEETKLTRGELLDFTKDCQNLFNYMHETIAKTQMVTKEIFNYHAKN